MANNVISVDFTRDQSANHNSKIDINLVMKSRLQSVTSDMMLPAREEVQIEVANEHTSEPIKDIDDIKRISEYLLSKGRYRDNMLFIVGINFGLRISDLLQLRFMHLLNDDLTFKTTFPILEKKTKNTRKVRRNRYITINDAVIDAVVTYLSHNQCSLDDFLFRSESSNSTNENKPISRQMADHIMKGIGRDLGLSNKMATHTLRKTFAFHQMAMSNNDPRKLLLLQKMFGHSSAAQTLDYIGITPEEIEDAYKKLNLGSANHYLINSRLQESVYSSVG